MVAVSFLALGTISPVGAESLSVAMVNINEVFQVHPATHRAQQVLQEEQAAMMAELEGLDEATAMVRQQEMQQELGVMQQRLVEAVLDDIANDVQEIADSLGFNVVVNPSGIVSGEELLDPVDITETVLSRFELQAPGP